MIYPEFRLHSILFALRSVIICNIYYHNLSFIYQIGTCIGTMIGADIVTLIYNFEGKNGKTMRNMLVHFILLKIKNSQTKLTKKITNSSKEKEVTITKQLLLSFTKKICK
jgi:hypothetical protein